ncbi:MAG: bifunctional folylpolyglutamate synthase/dihydrofolate synthase [Ruminococcaceae bacterium]|nr:bifunctional folylpolyglutamate synthase/dihydrofolate synthase [Oscillospiraceae bacterium]
MMTYEETLEYIHSVCWKGSRPGLERTRELLKMMGNPQDRLKYVHVAGTNGKGSVCSMLASVLKAAGYKTGLYTSPFVRYFNERMMINGEMISNGELSEITEYVRQFADKMTDLPTEFELITAIGFEYFARNNCDIVVLETGMGGRLDSTNIIETTVLSVITGIALDHTAYLGDTIEKIATEKAGIIKTGVPVVFGGKSLAAYGAISEVASEKGSELHWASDAELTDIEFSLYGCKLSSSNYKDLFVSLVGNYQPSNIATALKCIGVLRASGFSINEEQVRQGMGNVYWPARFEIINKDPLMIYDGAHNPEGLRACVDSIKRFFGDKKVNIISGVMADKDVGSMLPVIGEVADEVFTVIPNNPRSMDSKVYAEYFNNYGIKAHAFDTIEEGVRAALQSSAEKGCALVSLGTLYMYGDIRDALEKITEKAN